MWHWNEMYWETHLYDQINTQTVIFLNLGPRRIFGQNGIDVTWNIAQKVKLVKQLMTGIRTQYGYFLTD